MPGMRSAGLIGCIFLSTATPVAAQTPLTMPIVDTLALTSQPFLSRDAFHRALLSALPGLSIERDATNPPILDPFLWAIAGSFGPNGDRAIPGAIFICARYGLATRDYFAEHGFSTRETFELMGQVMPLPDDLEVWPEGAVARLHCSFVWDDERVVWILDEDPARLALEAVFTHVHPSGAEGSINPQGYRLDATGGARDSVAQVEGATVILTLGHQSVAFRSFLMGGGM